MIISNRAKSACEILNDATLVSRFTFDNVITDSGPNALSSSVTVQGNSGVSFVSGVVNQALMLSLNNSYFQSWNYHALGQVNRAYSFVLWINPTVSQGTILHLFADRTGAVIQWCLPMIGFSSNGEIVIQSWNGSAVSVVGPSIPIDTWTHIVHTWSSTNGLRLYVNGVLDASTVMPNFSASRLTTMSIFLGTSAYGTKCATTGIVMGSYEGAIDEFYVYNRELSGAEICPLAQP